MSTRSYQALVMTPESTHTYDWEFEGVPTLRTVLKELHRCVVQDQTSAIQLVSHSEHAAHAGGQSDELFNETQVFRHIHGDSWFSLYCPSALCPIQNQSSNKSATL